MTDPLFNLRELCKQLLLLEDHLAHQNRRCSDCIRKHLLTCEALAEEAVTLDTTGIFSGVCGNLAEQIRNWDEALIDGAHPVGVGQDIRKLRKQLTPMIFDPRRKEAIQRVASAYMRRVASGRSPAGCERHKSES